MQVPRAQHVPPAGTPGAEQGPLAALERRHCRFPQPRGSGPGVGRGAAHLRCRETEKVGGHPGGCCRPSIAPDPGLSEAGRPEVGPFFVVCGQGGLSPAAYGDYEGVPCFEGGLSRPVSTSVGSP